ncbi:MAG: hypothetical protein AUI97_00280 [Crenarchaeota archaeon 13_1_40CM_3_52_17]|nr:MAG: hypothetical protein AUI97_00280 [Crenarchaeota archaeon 13_1_40CM_3_52_17]
MVYLQVSFIIMLLIISSIVPVLVEAVRRRRRIVVWYKVEVDRRRMEYFEKRNQSRGPYLLRLLLDSSWP